MRHALSLLSLALVACGGGGGDAPQAAAPVTAIAAQPTAVAAPVQPAPSAAQPVAIAAPAPVIEARAPVAAAPVAPAREWCGPNQGGSMFLCHPDWPYATRKPADGATEAEVNGYNNNCTTVSCMLERCADGRVVSVRYSGACTATGVPLVIQY